MQLENGPSKKYNLDGKVENCDFQVNLSLRTLTVRI
jgi:hypothetical protein